MSETEKRLHVLINDEASLRWLESQDNMSASIRLLIQQVAREGLMDDYVMYCAQQAPSPFAKQGSVNVIEKTDEIDPVSTDLTIDEATDVVDVDDTHVELENNDVSMMDEMTADDNELTETDEETALDLDSMDEQQQNRVEALLSQRRKS